MNAPKNDMEHIENIGDLDVWANDFSARVTVDGETIISIPRADHGLDRLVKALDSLVK